VGAREQACLYFLFGVWCLVFGVWCLVYRVCGLVLAVSCVGLRVRGWGCQLAGRPPPRVWCVAFGV